MTTDDGEPHFCDHARMLGRQNVLGCPLWPACARPAVTIPATRPPLPPFTPTIGEALFGVLKLAVITILLAAALATLLPVIF